MMPRRAPPNPTPLYRLMHADNLATLLRRGGLHAPNLTPNDALPYRTIHDLTVQTNRQRKEIPCGPGATIHDYVPFYFGPLSVMLLNLKTGRVADYDEGQESLIYLTTTAQQLHAADCRFVFSDGHGLARFTKWYDDLGDLDEVDWSIVNARYWSDTAEDNDRKRRKQAEFLVWHSLDWSLIQSVAVLNNSMKQRIMGVLGQFPEMPQPEIIVRSRWYY
jgi:hypothetical protein